MSLVLAHCADQAELRLEMVLTHEDAWHAGSAGSEGRAGGEVGALRASR